MNHRRMSLSVLLAGITFAVFLQTWNFQFVRFDDLEYVGENEHVLSGLTVDNIKWAFSREAVQRTGNWHPLTWLSLMLDAEIFGDNAGGYHLTNCLLHTANVLLLFGFLRQATGSTIKSAFVAALFAVHPLHVESVAWISERKDVLSTIFGLGSLYAYVRFAQAYGRKWYAVSLLAFLLSLLSKQMYVTLPFLLLLWDFWPLQRTRFFNNARQQPEAGSPTRPVTADSEEIQLSGSRHCIGRLLWEKMPFFVLTLLFSIIAYAGQNTASAITSLEFTPLGFRISNALVVYVLYLYKTIVPVQLAVFYPIRPEIPVLHFLGAATILLTISAGALATWKTRPYLLTGWFWYLGTLVPVIGIIQIGSQRYADRYTYLPLIGFFIAVVWGIAAFAPAGGRRRTYFIGFATAVVIVLAGLAWQQTRTWRDSIALFGHAISVTEVNDIIHNNLAVAWLERGDTKKAEHHFRETLRINPRHIMALVNLSNLTGSDERLDETVELLKTAITWDPNHFVAHNNLGNVLNQQQRFREAETYLRRAEQIDPDAAISYCNLGFSLMGQGRFDEAVANFETAAKIDPKLAVRNEEVTAQLLQVGEGLAGRGQMEHAISHFRQALAWTPNSIAAQYDLAVALSATGQLEEAGQMYQKVLAATPQFAEGWNEFGEVLLRQGLRDAAIEQFRHALEIDPELESAQQNLQRAADN